MVQKKPINDLLKQLRGDPLLFVIPSSRHDQAIALAERLLSSPSGDPLRDTVHCVLSGDSDADMAVRVLGYVAIPEERYADAAEWVADLRDAAEQENDDWQKQRLHAVADHLDGQLKEANCCAGESS